MEQGQAIVTFEEVVKKKYIIIVFPDGVIGCYRTNADAFIQSIKNVQADCFDQGKILALVPVHLTEEEFLKLDGEDTEGEIIQ